MWSLLDDHFDSFLSQYAERFEKSYGWYRKVIGTVVDEYKKCGDLQHGFARIRCPGCRHEFLLAFSCKGRWFCPSCHARKVHEFGENLTAEILAPVPHRQYVFSIPKILRPFFRYERSLLTRLSQCARDSMVSWFRTILGMKDGIPGIVVSVQTFGDYARWHPHIHALVADGLFSADGKFFVMPDLDLTWLRELFRASVLRMLVEDGVIDEAFARRVAAWDHVSGFNVHNRVRLMSGDAPGLAQLSRYVARNPFSLAKMRYNPQSGKVVYKSKMETWSTKRNFEIFDALEFIALITQHIPEKSFQLIRYYGWYSNRTRGERSKYGLPLGGRERKMPVAVEVIDVADRPVRRIPSRSWRECIRKVFAFDPMACPACGDEMKIVGFVDEELEIRSILESLGEWRDDPDPPVPRGKGPPREGPPPPGEWTYEPFFEAA